MLTQTVSIERRGIEHPDTRFVGSMNSGDRLFFGQLGVKVAEGSPAETKLG